MESIAFATLRIIDANLNRIGEGLRFLEEVSRLMLNDTALTQQLKDMRHGLINSDAQLQIRMMQARDAGGDIGASMEVTGKENSRDLSSAVIANAKRAQEGLRVLEEMAKTPGLELDSDKFRKSRFALYTVEKNLLSGVLRQSLRQRMQGLYVIVDTAALDGRSHVEVTRQAIQGGVRIIQLRDKLLTKKQLLPIAQKMRDLCAASDALFIMNDDLDIALAVEADGLHVGQDDLPVHIARELLPADKILGSSAYTAEEVAVAEAGGADYIAVGAIFPTPSKEAIDVVGLARIRQIRGLTTLPIVAIGGIMAENMPDVITAGADAVAVISAALGATNVTEACRTMIKIIEREKNG
jgi:thiamine-phosphate pyrophosphorylase